MEQYLTKAIQIFQIHSLKKFGAIPRVTLFNKSHISPKHADIYIVDVTIDFEGTKTEIKNIGQVLPGESFFYDCMSLIPSGPEECLISFHLIPNRFYESQFVMIEKEDLYFYLTCQDHYVEYYLNGFCSGVLYQSAPFNYKKFSSESSTIIQAPKVHSASNLKSYMSLINNCVEDNYNTIATLKCSLTNRFGEVVSSWIENIQPKKVHFVELDHHFQKGSRVQSLGFYAISTNAVLLPLTFTFNARSKAFSIEHSLPPAYYSTNLRGEIRGKVVEGLLKSDFYNSLGLP